MEMWNSASRRFCPTPVFPWRKALCIRLRDPALSSHSFADKRKLNNGRRKWTKEEDDRLLQLKEDGVSFLDMMKHFPNRTFKAIHSHVYRPESDGGKIRAELAARGLIRRSEAALPEEELKAIQKLRADGATWREVQRQYLHRSCPELLHKMNTADRSSAGRRIPYTQAEDSQLLRSRREDAMLWREVQVRMPHRSMHSLKNRYKSLLSPDERRFVPGRKYLTKSEMKEVVRLRETGMLWRDIAKTIGDLGPEGLRWCYMREKYIPAEEERKGAWTEAEDRWLAATPTRKPKGWMVDAVMELRRSPTSIKARLRSLREGEAEKEAVQATSATARTTTIIETQDLAKTQHDPSDQPAPS